LFGNTTISTVVATVVRENGRKQDARAGRAVSTKKEEKYRMPEENIKKKPASSIYDSTHA
jgi:hypothetical protein